MNKGDNTLLIWVLSWAGLLLALLYSPLGSPDLYHPRKYFSEYQGVNFNKTAIVNAPRGGSNGNYAGNELEIPTNKSEQKKNYNYSVNATANSVFNSAGSVNVQNLSKEAIRQIAGSIGGSGNSGSGGNTNNNGGSSNFSVPRGSNNNLGGGIASSRLDLSLFSDSTATTTQASEYAQQRANSSDTGSDPLNEPVPVGDAWIFMIVMTLVYCGFKTNVFKLICNVHIIIFANKHK